jgi:aminopeptidase N
LSAPVRLEIEFSDDDLELLASHDSDPVNRWDAAQRSFVAAVLDLARAYRNDAALSLPPALASVAARLLADESSDPALVALALAPPDPAYVAALEPVVDPDGIMTVWVYLRRMLARTLRPAFERVHARRLPRAPYAPTPEQAGVRSLSNVALSYLAALDDDAAHAVATAQYDSADNMTDAIGAIAALRDSASPARDQLYARFEAKWRDEPLVLDKWFAQQARSLRRDALATVRTLLAHPRFNALNPNRVRSLVGTFSLANFAGFNASDGSGYAFTAEQVLRLDPTNPQLASALVGAFNLWKRYSEPRRGMMRRSLETIAGAAGLSPDVSEVVTRTLG